MIRYSIDIQLLIKLNLMDFKIEEDAIKGLLMI